MGFDPNIDAGDVTGASKTRVLGATVNSQSVIRAAESQDVAERGGLSGAATIGNGTVANGTLSSARQGVIDGVIGDSISNGSGSQMGLTDWVSVLAAFENRANGFPDPGFGFVSAKGALQTEFTNTNNSITATATNGTTTLTFASGATAVQNGMRVTGAGCPNGAGALVTGVNTGTGVVTLSGTSGTLTTTAYQFIPTGIMSGPSVEGLLDGVTALLPISGSSVSDGVISTGAAITNTITVTAGSTAVSGLSFPGSGCANGCSISAVGVPVGTTYSATNGFGSAVLSQAATASGTPSGITTRPCRRVKIYYQTFLNGDNVTFNVYNTAGTVIATSGSLPTHVASGTSYQVWDSGDLGLPATAVAGITAAWATHTVGLGGAGVYVVGARYYQTSGLGVTIDQFGYGATTSNFWVSTNTWATTQPNWAQWMQQLAAAGTPMRRLYVMVGINDPSSGISSSTYQTNLTSIVSFAKAASPLTEVVLCVEHYGDVIATNAACSSAGVTNGSVTITGANITTTSPIVGATVVGSTGTAIPTGMVATVTAAGTGTCTVNVTGTLPSSASVTYSFANTRGGGAAWAANWVTAAEQVAISSGVTLVNMFERFGDISIQAQIASVTLTAGSATATVASSFPGVAAGQAVWVQSGTGTLPNGTTVQSVSGTNLVLTQVPLTGGTATLTFSKDIYGFGQLSTADIHFGDYTQSFSGGDGQRAMAETFFNKLAFSRSTPRSAIFVSTVLPTSAVKTTPSATLPSTVSFSVVASATVALTYGPTTGTEYTIYPSTVTTVKTQFTIPKLPAGWSYVFTYSAGSPSAVTQVG
jgi:hypothetical protein